MGRKADTAIYIGKHKVCHRGIQEGIYGVVYEKNGEQVFESYEEFFKDFFNGPRIIIDKKVS